MVDVIFLEKKNCEWFDSGERRLLHGVNHAFKIIDQKSGEWLVNVKISDEGKAVVSAPTSQMTSSIHDQLKRKTIVFNPCKDRNELYNLLGISYIGEGRLHYERLEDVSFVPPEIRRNFELTIHEAVAGTDRFKGKIVVIVSKEKPEDMALLFFLQRIKPVF